MGFFRRFFGRLPPRSTQEAIETPDLSSASLEAEVWLTKSGNVGCWSGIHMLTLVT